MLSTLVMWLRKRCALLACSLEIRRLSRNFMSPTWDPCLSERVLSGPLTASALNKNWRSRVQRRFIKALCGMQEISYEKLLVHLQLDSLANRRHRVDLLMAFKALRGGQRIDANTIGLQLATSSTCSNGSNHVARRSVNNNIRGTFKFRVCK